MRRILLLFGIIACWITGYGQGSFTLSTASGVNYDATNGVTGNSAITFVIENTNSTPYILEGVDYHFSTHSSGTNVDLWYTDSDLSGTPSIASPAWTKITASPVNLTITSNGYMPVFTGLNFTIPGNTVYRFAIQSSKDIDYSDNSPLASPNNFSANGVTLYVGDHTIASSNVGYGGSFTSPTNTPRFFTGAVTLKQGIRGNCTPFTNFSTDSTSAVGIEVDWTPGSGNTSFFMEYGPAGFTPGSGTPITGTYPGSQPPVYIGGLSPETDYDIYFGEICNSGADSVFFPDPQTVTTDPVCFPVNSIALNGVTSSGATFTVNSPETNFDYEYGPTGFMQGTGSTGTSGNPVSITGLSGQTTYDIYVRSNCTGSGNGVSAVWVGPYTFITACAPQTGPYYNGFENDTLDGPPLCWESYVTGTSAFVEVEDFTGTAAPYAGTQALYLYSGSSSTTPGQDTLVAISPQFTDLTAGDKRIRFWANSDNPSSQLIVGTLSSSGPGAVFTPVDTITFTSQDTYQQANVYFTAANGYNGTDEFIALAHSLGATFEYIRIDEFNYETIPPCPDPTNIVIDYVTGTSAGFSFDAYGTSSFEYEVGPTGFVQGMGTMGSGGNPLIINGLSPATSYDVYIRADCSGSGNGSSNWVGPVNFSTGCAAPTAVTLPFLEDFEGASDTIVGNKADAYCRAEVAWSFETSSQTDGRLQFSTYANGGNRGASMDEVANNLPANYLIGTLDMSNYDTSSTSFYLLSFYHNSHGDEVHAGDSVWIRGSVNDPWIGVYDLYANQTNGTFVHAADIDLKTSLIRAGQNFSSTFQMRFGQQDDSPITSMTATDGRTFDDIMIEEINCLDPLGFEALNVTSSSASLVFDQIGDNYEVEYGPCGFTQGTGTALSGSEPFAATGLNPSTCYEVYVRRNCGTSFSNWVGPFSFTTACTAFTATYYNGFENDSLDLPPVCWEGYVTGTSAFVEVEDFTGTAAPYAGAQALYLYSGSSSTTPGQDTLVAISPQFSDMTAGDKRLVFQANSDGPSSKLIIGTLPNTNPSATFTPLDTVTFGAADTYEEVIVYLTASNGYNGTDEYIGLVHSLGSTFQYVRIDEFTYETIPPCPDPSKLSITALTDGSVSFSFDAYGTSSFDYEVGPSGFVQGTGTVSSGGNPGTITGLTPNTTYDLYIRANCSGSGNGTSGWIGPITFTTLCNALMAPYFENFETFPIGFYDGIDQCWSVESNNPGTTPSGGFSWEVRNTPQTTSTNTGPNVDHTLYPSSGGSWFHSDNSGGTSGDSTMLLSPLVDISSLTTPELEYHFHNFAAPTSAFRQPLYVDIFDGVMWHTKVHDIDSVFQSSGTDPWKDTIIDLAPYSANGIVQVRFRTKITRSSGGAGDVAIDDVRISDPPTCLDPTNLGAFNILPSSVDIYWEETGSAANWNIEYGPAGFTPGSGTSMMVSNDTVNLPGLMPNTSYEFYVQADCGSDGPSFWIGPYSFTTACTAFTAPYFNDFESDALDVPPSCWDAYVTATTAFVEVEDFTGTAAPYAGAQALYLYSGNSSTTPGQDTLLAISPQFSDMPAGDKRLVFQANSDDPVSKLIVGTLPNTNPGATFSPLDTILFPTPDTYQQVVVYLTTANGYNGTDEYIGLMHNLGATVDYVRIDDFSYEVIPACPDPVNVVLNSVTNSSATFGFDAFGTSSFDYEVGPTGFTQGGGTISSGGNPGTVTGLSSNTTYDVYIRANCTGSGNGTSNWVGPITFTTVCDPVIAPYLEDFESFTVGQYDGVENCWNFVSNNPGTTPSGGFSWEVRNTPQTTSTNTGPNVDNTLYPNSGGKWIHSDNSGGSSGDSTMLISPLVDVSGLTNPELEYNFHNFAAPTSTYRQPLYVDIFDGVMWHTKVHDIDSVFQSSGTDPWKDTIIDLTPYSANGIIQVRFRTKITRSSGGAGDVAIDDVRISNPPTCPDPSDLGVGNITTTSAEIFWKENGSAMMWNVQYGPAGFSLGGGNQVSVSNDTTTLSPLNASSPYEFYVQADCGGNDTSFWIGPFSFATLCATVPAPYLENFESHTVGHYDGTDICWDFISNNPGTTPSGGFSWEVRNTPQTTSTNTGPAGDHTLYPNTGGNWIHSDNSGGSSNDSTLLVSPMIDISTLSTPELKYYFHNFAAPTSAYRQPLYVDIFDGVMWHYKVHDIDSVFQSAATDPWKDTIIDLTPYSASGIVQVRFRSQITRSSGGAGDVAIDDVSITNAGGSFCPAPTGVGVVGVACDTANLGWTSAAGKQSLIEYGPTGFTLGSGTKVNYVISPYSLTGLMPNTTYDFYVADTCGNDTSAWVMSSFTTANGPISAAFTATNGAPTATLLTVSFDASASVGATAYSWDFGDGASGTGVNTTHDYTANGAYQVTLTVTGPCGTATLSDSVTIAGVSLEENLLSRSLEIYPNPTSGKVNVSFETEGSEPAVLTIMDLTGKIVHKVKFTDINGRYDGEVDITKLALGTYMLRVESGSLNAVNRIVKQ